MDIFWVSNYRYFGPAHGASFHPFLLRKCRATCIAESSLEEKCACQEHKELGSPSAPDQKYIVSPTIFRFQIAVIHLLVIPLKALLHVMQHLCERPTSQPRSASFLPSVRFMVATVVPGSTSSSNCCPPAILHRPNPVRHPRDR